MQRRTILVASAGLLAAPGLPRAQSAWPDRPIRLVVPWPPGGSTDTIARIFQPKLGEVLKRPIIIDNRGGASGSVGAIEAARAQPDGYTWMLAYDNEAPNQTLLRLPYRTLEAFAPVSLVANGPLALVAHQSTPYQSFQDVIRAAKASPDTIAFATSGTGGLAHVATTLLQQEGGFKLVHVPYRGGGPAVQDAVAGTVPLFMSNVVIISQHIKAGTLRPLGVTTAGESKHVPGCPSFAAQGFRGFQAPTWWAFFGRTGTPEPIMRHMQEALAETLADPGVRQKIEEQGADVIASSPDECRTFIAAEIDRWGKVIRDNHINADS